MIFKITNSNELNQIELDQNELEFLAFKSIMSNAMSMPNQKRIK